MRCTVHPQQPFRRLGTGVVGNPNASLWYIIKKEITSPLRFLATVFTIVGRWLILFMATLLCWWLLSVVKQCTTALDAGALHHKRNEGDIGSPQPPNLVPAIVPSLCQRSGGSDCQVCWLACSWSVPEYSPPPPFCVVHPCRCVDNPFVRLRHVSSLTLSMGLCRSVIPSLLRVCLTPFNSHSRPSCTLFVFPPLR